MSIYSANRTGSVVAETARCNEGYTAADLGRIMYESQVNDMAIFESIVLTDLAEAKGIAEGTLLLSEAEEANKKTAKEIIETLKKKIIGFWEKIKGAFKAAITKISAYLLRDNKAFIADFKARYAKKTEKGAAGEVEIVYYDVNTYKTTIPTADTITDAIKASKDADNVKSAEVVNKALGECLGAEVEGTKDYKKKVIEKYGQKMTVNDNNHKKLLDILENAKDTIKSLKELEKQTSDSVNSVINALKKAEQLLQREADNKDDANAHGQIVKNLSTLVSAYETVIANTTSVGIAMVKANVKNARKGLSGLIKSVTHEDAILAEAAATVENDEIDAALTDAPAEPALDAETQTEVEELVAAADAEL